MGTKIEFRKKIRATIDYFTGTYRNTVQYCMAPSLANCCEWVAVKQSILKQIVWIGKIIMNRAFSFQSEGSVPIRRNPIRRNANANPNPKP